MKTYRKFILLIIIFFISFSLQDFTFAKDEGLRDYYENKMEKPDYTVVKAKIIEITYDDTEDEKKDIPIESDIRYQHLKVKLLNGNHKGEIYTVENMVEMFSPYKLIFKENDKMILRLNEDENGKVNNLKIYEKSREGKVYFIIGVFILLLIFIGGVQGVKTVGTLILTALIIIYIFLPLIIKGYNPIIISIIISIIAVVFTLSIISGLNKKTLIAILGTTAGLIIAGIFALAVGLSADLTGLTSEEAQMLAFIPQYRNIDYQGLLFGGIIIGAIGAIMDVAISVSSAMWEIKEVQPKIKSLDLIKSGMNIGKDIMGSMSNTLILAYVGTTIHLMIIFSIFNMSFTEIINLDYVASEIIRAMAGSIGLICSVPITVFISAGFAKKP